MAWGYHEHGTIRTGDGGAKVNLYDEIELRRRYSLSIDNFVNYDQGRHWNEKVAGVYLHYQKLFYEAFLK